MRKHEIPYLGPRKDTNVYPGERLGMSPEAVRDFIKRQKRCKGQSYSLAVGDNSDLDVQLPGTAYMLLGFAFSFSGLADPSTADGLVNLVVNNEIVIEDVFAQFYGPDYTDEEYYFIPRPIDGTDDIRFEVNGVTAVYTLNVNYYYL